MSTADGPLNEIVVSAFGANCGNPSHRALPGRRLSPSSMSAGRTDERDV